MIREFKPYEETLKAVKALNIAVENTCIAVDKEDAEEFISREYPFSKDLIDVMFAVNKWETELNDTFVRIGIKAEKKEGRNIKLIVSVGDENTVIQAAVETFELSLSDIVLADILDVYVKIPDAVAKHSKYVYEALEEFMKRHTNTMSITLPDGDEVISFIVALNNNTVACNSVLINKDNIVEDIEEKMSLVMSYNDVYSVATSLETTLSHLDSYMNLVETDSE